MRFFFIGMLAMVGMIGCRSRPACDLTDKYSKVAGYGVAAIFDCHNKDQVVGDLEGEVAKLNLCAATTAAGPISAIICRPVAGYVTTLVVKQALPKSWDCHGGVPSSSLTAFIYANCILLPF